MPRPAKIYQHTPEDRMKRDLLLWTKWRKSQSHMNNLGYPSMSAEQERTGTSKQALPDWSTEMHLDQVIENIMPKEYRRILFAAKGIPLSLKALERNDIWISGMKYNKRLNLYYFPETASDTAKKALGIAKPTYDNLWRCCRAWLIGKEYS